MLTLLAVDEVGLAAPARLEGGRTRALADPAARFWTLTDLGEVFGRKDIAAQVRWWRGRHGFPCPLPWSARPLRWSPEAVLRWKAAREQERQPPERADV